MTHSLRTHGFGLLTAVLLLACGRAQGQARVDLTDLRALVFEMRVDDFDARQQAGDALRKLGPSAVPELTRWLHAEDSTLTKLLAGVAEEFTVPAYDWHGYAASALGEIGTPAASAIADLEVASREVLTQVSPEHRDFVTTRARAALIKIRGEKLDPLEAALAALQSPSWRSELAMAAELGTFGRPLVNVLARLASDPASTQRYLVVKTLARIDGAGQASRQALVERLADSDNTVRWFALRALRPAQSPSAQLREAVAALLQDPVRSVREQAIETLAILTPPEQAQACAALIEPLLRDPAEEVRARAKLQLDALAKRDRSR